MWEKLVEPDKPQMTIQRVHFAFWITNATDIRSECVKLIAFTRQKWLRERALMLRYTYITCVVFHKRHHFISDLRMWHHT